VTVTVQPHPEGTLVRLEHRLADPEMRDRHLPGWRFQLSLFANVVAREEHAGVAALVDRYFALWNEPDPQRRAAALQESVEDQVQFRDDFAAIQGRADLADHVTASRLHMPGLTLARDGEPLQCQGTALVDWSARGPDGAPRGRGTTVFDLGPSGRLARIVGFWRR
jgi:hypothetical protein